MRHATKKTLAALGIFAAVWLGVRYLMPLFSPFVVGALLALAAEPMAALLQRRLHLPRSVSTGIGVSMTFCFLTIVLLMLFGFLVRELRTLAGLLPNLEQAAGSALTLVRSWLLDLSSHMPQSVQPLVQDNIGTLFSDGASLIGRAAAYLLGLAGTLLSHVPDSALSLGTAVISAFLISVKLPRIKKWCLRRIPKERLRALGAAGKRIKTVLGHWLVAQCKLTGVTFVILSLGFLILRIPYALVWALGVCLVDAFPVLGTGTVLLPWGLLCLLQGDTPRAVGIVSLYIVVTLTRSALEPKLLGRHLGLDPLVTLMTMYAGFKLWGITGMFFAPILAVIALQVVPSEKT